MSLLLPRPLHLYQPHQLLAVVDLRQVHQLLEVRAPHLPTGTQVFLRFLAGEFLPGGVLGPGVGALGLLQFRLGVGVDVLAAVLGEPFGLLHVGILLARLVGVSLGVVALRKSVLGPVGAHVILVFDRLPPESPQNLQFFGVAVAELRRAYSAGKSSLRCILALRRT